MQVKIKRKVAMNKYATLITASAITVAFFFSLGLITVLTI
jgi:hypothetical protein